MLFSTTNQGRLFNNSPDAPRIITKPMTDNLPPVPGLDLGPVFDYRLQRRLSQSLLPQLTEGTLQTLLVTGPEGSGKSTLVSYLGNRLSDQGFAVIAISGSAATPVTTARVLAAFEYNLRRMGLKDELAILLNPRIGLEDRIGFVAAMMNRQSRIVLILDGLEWSLDADNRFIDPTMAPLFFYMLDQINGKSRCIAASRVTPVSGGPAPLPATCREARLDAVIQLDQKEPGLDERDLIALRRAQVFNHPVPVAGMAAVIGAEVQEAEKLLEYWQSEGVAYGTEVGGTLIWYIKRPLPDSIPALDAEATKEARGLAGDYLLSLLQTQQLAGLQRSWLDVAVETINHLMAADALDDAVMVAEPVNLFLEQLGFFWEQEQLNRKILQKVDHLGLLYSLAMALLRQGNNADAAATLEQVVKQTAGKSVREEALALYELANMGLQRGMVDDSLKKFAAALNINRANGETKGAAACLTQIGMIHIHTGKGEKALPVLEEALQLQRPDATPEELAQLLPWVAEVQFRHGDSKVAKELFEEVLPILRDLKDQAAEAQVLQQMATLDLNAGRHLESLDGFQRSINIKRELDDKKGEAATFFQLGRLAKAVRHQDSCMRFIGLCYLIDRELGSPDAANEKKIFDEIVATVGLTEDVSKEILSDLWAEYKLDRGQGLMDRTFKKLLGRHRPVIPIKAL